MVQQIIVDWEKEPIQLNLSVVQSAILEASQQVHKLALRWPSCPGRYFNVESSAIVEIVLSSKPVIHSDVIVCAENLKGQPFSEETDCEWIVRVMVVEHMIEFFLGCIEKNL
jgi:hypothetical protein